MPRRIEDLEELQIYLDVDGPSRAEVLRRRNDYADSGETDAKLYVDHVDLCNEYLEVSAL
jgi:hypothetical protein